MQLRNDPKTVEDLEKRANTRILMLANHRRRSMCQPDLLEDSYLATLLSKLLENNRQVIRSKASRFNRYFEEQLPSLLGFEAQKPTHFPDAAYALVVEETTNYAQAIKQIEKHLLSSKSFTEPHMSFFCCKVVEIEDSLTFLYVLHSFPMTIGQLRSLS